LADSPIVYWKLEEASGTTAADSSGNGRNGTYSGSPSLGATAGPVPGGTAMTLDGVNDCVTIPYAAWVESASFSVEVWFKTTTGGSKVLVSRDNTNGDPWMLAFIGTSGSQPYFPVRTSADTRFPPLSDSPALNGSWHHMVATFDGVTKAQKVYLDGALYASTTAGAAVLTGAEGLSVGRRGAGSPVWYTGSLSQVAFYGTALSATRVAAHYNAATNTSLTAAVTATLPALTSAVAAVSTVTASASVVMPALTGSVAATNTDTAQISATLPALAAALSVQSDATVTAAVAAALPGLLANADVAVPAMSEIAAVLPPLGAVLTVAGADAIAATLPALTAHVEAVTATALTGWDIEQSQQALFSVVGDDDVISGPLLVDPPIAVAPPTIVERPIMRQSHIMPALVPDAAGLVRTDGTHEVVESTVGVPHLFVSGRDVTYWSGVPVQLGEFTASQPGGDEVAAVEFPWLTPFHETGVGDLAWLRDDAPVEIVMVAPDGTRTLLWAGHLVSDNAGHDEQNFTSDWHLEGALSQLDYVGHKVPTIMNPDPSDVGRVISKLGTNFVSRRFVAIKPVNTGIFTRTRGSYGDTEWDYIQNLLGPLMAGSGRSSVSLVRGTTSSGSRTCPRSTGLLMLAPLVSLST
jgi:hypothetical protein